MFELTREVPDTDLADVFEGEPMVQSFLVGDLGRVWITTAEAMTVPFGFTWVLGRLAAYEPDELRALLAAGPLRLRVAELVAA